MVHQEQNNMTTLIDILEETVELHWSIINNWVDPEGTLVIVKGHSPKGGANNSLEGTFCAIGVINPSILVYMLNPLPDKLLISNPIVVASKHTV